MNNLTMYRELRDNISKVEDINVQLEEKMNKHDILTMDNMGQDIKEAMTGGSVAVVGKNTILAENIVNNQVTPVKTSFIKLSKNLFNKEEVKKGYYWNVSSGEQANADFSYIKIPCEDGRTYIVTGTNYNTSIFNSAGVRLGSDTNSDGKAQCTISTVGYVGSSYFIINFRHNTYSVDTFMVVEGSVLPTDYINFGYRLDDNITVNREKIITVKKDGTGDFTTVYNAVKHAELYATKEKPCTIYIYDTSTNYKGTSFDILGEMGGTSYLATITTTSNTQLGMGIKDYINLTGVGKVKLYAHLPDTCTLAQSTCFSTIDVLGECTLENLTIEIKNGRYPVHDETNNKSPNSKHRFKKCKMIHLGNKSGLWASPHAYAGGTSGGCIFEYEDCVFDSSASSGYPWDIHNYAPQQGSVITFNGCKMIKSNSQETSIKLGFNGYSPVTTSATDYETCFNDVYLKNIIADGKITVSPEVNSYDCTNNYRLYNFTNLVEDIKPDFIKS